ncbi:hypothetical protein ACFXGA_11120 [Actinosynnema sp. NPDC059335]|uniref:hypothetical protein n=1 Tax=Actinosynnema sp. NPDC059335 TaxID=3346804 RepID=UPI00366B3EBF
MIDHHEQDPLCRDTVSALAAQFGGRVPRSTVARTVADARLDLEGRIQSEALADMLHRLARHRLDAMITART